MTRNHELAWTQHGGEFGGTDEEIAGFVAKPRRNFLAEGLILLALGNQLLPNGRERTSSGSVA